MGFAVRVRSAGQKYGPTCHQRDRADVTEFVTLVRLSSLGQHVGVLALAGYKRRKSALTADPIANLSSGIWLTLFEEFFPCFRYQSDLFPCVSDLKKYRPCDWYESSFFSLTCDGNCFSRSLDYNEIQTYRSNFQLMAKRTMARLQVVVIFIRRFVDASLHRTCGQRL